MTRVIAQGTFDLLHTGHLHYLRDAATHGDELVVIVSRASNVEHKPDPLLPAEQRRDLIDALAVVDRAILGHDADIFVPIERLDPDVIVLGYDQHHEEAALERELAARDIDASIVRASKREPQYDDEVLSSSEIVERILERRGHSSVTK